jgi:hypothetical protein
MADAVYSARNALPVFLTRGRANAIAITVVDSAGDAATIASGTIDVWDASGVKVVDEIAVAVSPATYTVLAAVVPVTLALSGNWQIGWNLTIGSTAYRFIQPAHLVRWTLKAPVVESDVTTRHSEASDLLSASQDLSDILTAAWERILRRLLQAGRMPWLVLDSFSLFDTHLSETMHMLYLDAHASVGGSGKYLEMADFYRTESDRLFGQLVLTYDDDEDGLPDEGEQGASAQAPMYMGGPGRGWSL